MNLPKDFFTPPMVFHAYAPDGTYKGQVKLTAESRERYEAKGFTFKNVRRPFKQWRS